MMTNTLSNIQFECIVLGKIIDNNNIYYKNIDLLNNNLFSDLLTTNLFKEIKLKLDSKQSISYLSLQETFKDKPEYLNLLELCRRDKVGCINVKSLIDSLKDLSVKRILNGFKNTLDIENIDNKQLINSLLITYEKLTNFSNDTDYNDIEDIETIKQNYLQELKDNILNKENNQYLKTNMLDFDNEIIGIPRKCLTILAGRPSMGKSTLVLQMALNIANNGKKVIFFSQEMNKKELIEKIIANKTQLKQIDLQKHNVKIQEIEEIQNKELIKNNLYIVEKTVKPIDIENYIKVFNNKIAPVDLIIVDHLQIAESNNETNNNNNKYDDITREYKRIAKQYNCGFICLSQLSRMVETREDKHPLLSDLRDSGTIEQNADLIMFIFRPYYYLKDSAKIDKQKLDEVKNTAEITIQKNRNGKCGLIKMYVDLSRSLFTDFIEM